MGLHPFTLVLSFPCLGITWSGPYVVGVPLPAPLVLDEFYGAIWDSVGSRGTVIPGLGWGGPDLLFRLFVCLFEGYWAVCYDYRGGRTILVWRQVMFAEGVHYILFCL